MKSLLEVARRLEGMAQNAADRAESCKHTQKHYDIERARMVEFIELAQVIHNHLQTCNQSQSR